MDRIDDLATACEQDVIDFFSITTLLGHFGGSMSSLSSCVMVLSIWFLFDLTITLDFLGCCMLLYIESGIAVYVSRSELFGERGIQSYTDTDIRDAFKADQRDKSASSAYIVAMAQYLDSDSDSIPEIAYQRNLKRKLVVSRSNEPRHRQLQRKLPVAECHTMTIPNDSDIPVINQMRATLGIQNKIVGQPRRNTVSLTHQASLTRKRNNRYKREIIVACGSRLAKEGISEDTIVEVLRWPQTRNIFPKLHEAVQGVGREMKALESAIRHGFESVGRSHLQACTALFTHGLPIQQAQRISGQQRKYITKARLAETKTFRLVTEQYAPHVRRRRVVDIETKSTREHMQTRLHNQLSDTLFRHSPFDVLYHEDYQNR